MEEQKVHRYLRIALNIIFIGSLFLSLPLILFGLTLGSGILIFLSIPIFTILALILGQRSLLWFLLPFLGIAMVLVYDKIDRNRIFNEEIKYCQGIVSGKKSWDPDNIIAIDSRKLEYCRSFLKENNVTSY